MKLPLERINRDHSARMATVELPSVRLRQVLLIVVPLTLGACTSADERIAYTATPKETTFNTSLAEMAHPLATHTNSSDNITSELIGKTVIYAPIGPGQISAPRVEYYHPNGTFVMTGDRTQFEAKYEIDKGRVCIFKDRHVRPAFCNILIKDKGKFFIETDRLGENRREVKITFIGR